MLGSQPACHRNAALLVELAFPGEIAVAGSDVQILLEGDLVA